MFEEGLAPRASEESTAHKVRVLRRARQVSSSTRRLSYRDLWHVGEDLSQSTTSDAALVRACLASDERAWAQLVQRFEKLVYSTALEEGLDAEDAGDVFQQVWMELHQSLPRIRNPQALPRWLIIATRRLCYKVAVRRRRMVHGLTREMIDPARLADEKLTAIESRHRVESTLTQLGGKCERLLRLLFFHSKRIPYEEISRRTGLAVGSIGPIRNRCLARMRKMLEASS